jgi:vesicle coat complex subunit
MNYPKELALIFIGFLLQYELDLSRATGVIDLKDDLISKLSRVVQLTGFSDPVYAEAIVNVHQYDILLGKHKQTSYSLDPFVCLT